MSDQGEGAHEEEEDGRTILRVAIELPGHTDQSQKTSSFQQADQSGGLRRSEETEEGGN